jgi:hypothetical protein
MARGILLAVMMVIGLTGCSSHRASLYTINGNETFIGWNDQDKLPRNSFYVLIEGDAEGVNWTVKEIYDHPISGRSNENQEVLFVDKDFAYVQPYFEINESTVVKVGETTDVNWVGRANSNGQPMVTGMDVHTKANYLDRGSWECGFIIQPNKDKYTSCTTRLTKTNFAKSVGKNIVATVLTLGLMTGTHQVVDKEKIARIITHTNLFEKIKQSGLYTQASGQ